MTPSSRSKKTLSTILVLGTFCLLAACANSTKPSLHERVAAMSDTDLVAYYQGVDARLKAVGDGVRRDRDDTGQAREGLNPQLTYFLGGEGHRLLRERDAAEKELVRRQIPRNKWASGPD